MTLRQLTPLQKDAFIEDAQLGWMAAADAHQIPEATANLILMDALLQDFDKADTIATTLFVVATLNALSAKRAHGEDSPEMADSIALREKHGAALIIAMQKLCDVELATTVIPGARLQ
jgi:hypothetical protein